MGNVVVINVRGFDVDNYEGVFVYVGRRCYGFEGSVLGNPYKIGKDGDRADVIRKYRVWLWGEYRKGGRVKDEVDRIVELVKSGMKVRLG